MRSYNETRSGPDIFHVEATKRGRMEEEAGPRTHALHAWGTVLYFALTGLVQRELECRSKGYPFASPELFAIPSKPRAQFPVSISARRLSEKRGTRDQPIALGQLEGFEVTNSSEVTLDLSSKLIRNPAHEEQHPCRRPQEFTQTR